MLPKNTMRARSPRTSPLFTYLSVQSRTLNGRESLASSDAKFVDDNYVDQILVYQELPLLVVLVEAHSKITTLPMTARLKGQIKFMGHSRELLKKLSVV